MTDDSLILVLLRAQRPSEAFTPPAARARIPLGGGHVKRPGAWFSLDSGVVTPQPSRSLHSRRWRFVLLLRAGRHSGAGRRHGAGTHDHAIGGSHASPVAARAPHP